MNRVTNYIEENYPDYMDKILLADGFEDAFIGVVQVSAQSQRLAMIMTLVLIF